MAKPNRDHGVHHEPHFSLDPHQADQTEAGADELLQREWDRASLADHVEHNVWEEPAVSRVLSGDPDESQLTYQGWLWSALQDTSRLHTWGVTLLVILAAGPAGIVGALITGTTGAGAASGVAGFGQVLAAVVMGPITEEITKIALALWIVEKRPYWFSSIGQILLCAAAGGLAFAAIENLVYFHIYVPEHTAEFERFRWTACVGLHVGCSLTAGLGLARIWDNAIRNLHRPRIAMGVPWFVTAMVGHGLYNLGVIIASAAGWLDFSQPPPA